MKSKYCGRSKICIRCATRCFKSGSKVTAMILARLCSSIHRPYCFLLLIVCVLLVYVAFSNYAQYSLIFIVHDSVQPQPRNNQTIDEGKVILLWTGFFGTRDYVPTGTDGLRKAGCPEHRCEVTSDRSRLSSSDVIVFHSRDVNMADLPRTRSPHQRWIFYCLESPHHSYYPAFRFMRSIFNWTMSYRLDSDVVTSYGGYKKHNIKEELKDLSSLWKGKQKMAVWLVSNCFTPGNREGFVEELKNYVSVDIFGACGEKPCPNDKLHECLLEYVKNYKFFLALENSVCKDYVTEKFFRILSYDIIPVVFGGGGYSQVAPPNSYIDALSYSTTSDLAKHLISVANNYTLYRSYFAWRENYYLPTYVPLICKLCEALHSPYIVSYRIYPDITDWWVNQADCKRWDSEKFV